MFAFLFCAIIAPNIVSGYTVVLSGEGDIILGETTQFKAEVFDDSSALSTSEFRFTWSDNALPKHSATLTSKSPSLWNVTYDSVFSTNTYEVTVKVHKNFVIWYPIGSATKTFNVTTTLKGEIALSQGNVTRKKYVSNVVPVTHEIILKKSYIDFSNKTKNFVRTFWFVDCVYYGQENGFKFVFNYTKPEEVHYVEALLVTSYIPEKHDNVTVLTTSTERTVISTPVTTYLTSQVLPYTPHTNLTASTPAPTTNSSVDNQIANFSELDPIFREWLLNFNKTHNVNMSRVSDFCLNSSIIPVSPNYNYSFFRTNFTTKSPIKVSPINGTNWLMDGEILNISVSCNGSSPYTFCVILKAGLYNVTNNETCREETVIRNCSFGIQHLFKKPSEYTLVVIISNAVSRIVKPIAVNIYKVKKHAQLSVIIVPVSFSLIATILIIFGVAYYVQNKRKYTIEVADFDFGNQTSNMEYKTFRERLRESISNSFLKSHDYEDSDSAWSDSAAPYSRKYGSMQ